MSFSWSCVKSGPNLTFLRWKIQVYCKLKLVRGWVPFHAENIWSFITGLASHHLRIFLRHLIFWDIGNPFFHLKSSSHQNIIHYSSGFDGCLVVICLSYRPHMYSLVSFQLLWEIFIRFLLQLIAEQLSLSHHKVCLQSKILSLHTYLVLSQFPGRAIGIDGCVDPIQIGARSSTFSLCLLLMRYPSWKRSKMPSMLFITSGLFSQ